MLFLGQHLDPFNMYIMLLLCPNNLFKRQHTPGTRQSPHIHGWPQGLNSSAVGITLLISCSYVLIHAWMNIYLG
jgi:hypothetical protein